MAVLKKIGASTLLETIVATVLILVIFAVSSLVINTAFRNNLSGDTTAIENRLNELEYRWLNNTMELPYEEDFQYWEITIDRLSKNDDKILWLRAERMSGKRSLELTRYYAK